MKQAIATHFDLAQGSHQTVIHKVGNKQETWDGRKKKRFNQQQGAFSYLDCVGKNAEKENLSNLYEQKKTGGVKA